MTTLMVHSNTPINLPFDPEAADDLEASPSYLYDQKIPSYANSTDMHNCGSYVLTQVPGGDYSVSFLESLPLLGQSPPNIPYPEDDDL